MTFLPDRYRAALRHRPRLTALVSHLVLSAIVCGAIGLLVIGWLYPREYARMAGGTTLFWMVAAVDLTIGPLLTCIVFDVRKPRVALARDLAVIATLQLAALAYGAHTLYAARPVALVFEVDRFRLLSPSMIAVSELAEAPAAYRTLPSTEVWTLGSRRPADSGQERLRAIELALEGYDIAQRPSYWQPYEASRASAWGVAKPLAPLLKTSPHLSDALRSMGDRNPFDVGSARFLPVVARNGSWVAVLKPEGDVVGFLPVDGF